MSNRSERCDAHPPGSTGADGGRHRIYRKGERAPNAGAVRARWRGAPYSTIRLRPASGRTLTAVEAGLAGTWISSPVRGETIVRAFLADLRARVILNRPGSVKVPTARFLMWRSMRSPNSSSTAETSLFGSPVDSESEATNCVLNEAATRS